MVPLIRTSERNLLKTNWFPNHFTRMKCGKRLLDVVLIPFTIKPLRRLTSILVVKSI